MKKGYFGIGIYMGKNTFNIGTLWRSAYNFGANFIFIIGKRVKKQSSDTVNAWKHIPLYRYDDYSHFKKSIPYACQIVCIEKNDKSKPLNTYKHANSCIYLLGAEDSGIPKNVLENKEVVHINTPACLNVATAGSIVMYDRLSKLS